ncbi:TetR/AcrR family transcriptional regulator [Gottfriedia solisilvae]|uniref:Transcriptional regulator n=1 Tax=Gottfriedia solisilvae TaxID=1516104 RepID=A0A8J3ABQ3_9BACI|nr:TetR/AcrR family transcriptional regulator [Gottfriedia solisilvae]GGI10363.1 transcriptional regulator [Gottfriedia solisilvae]
MKRDKPKFKQIIDAAVVVIAENGYHQAQVSKIAKKAGVADGTIYLYFKNKESILITLFEEKMGVFAEKIREEIAGNRDAVSKLLTLVKTHFREMSNDLNLAIVMQLEVRQTNLDLRVKINEVLKEYLHIIDSILMEGVKEGLFDENLDIRMARKMIFGTIDEVMTHWVMTGQNQDLEANAEKVHQLLIRGCGYQKERSSTLGQ